MSDKPTVNETFRFDEPGTLPRPGPIGRSVRLVLGVVCGLLVWRLLLHGDSGDLLRINIWVLVGFGLVLVPYVVNIGLGVRWGFWPAAASAVLLGGAALTGWLVSGEFASDVLWWVTLVWMLYVYGHLGVSFLLSALLATPGCEMRAVPHLLGLISGSEAREHYCPGFIDAVDRWERGEAGGVESADWLATPGRMLLIYGIPFLALQLAGNLGGWWVGNGVPALAFLFVGLVCLINGLRTRRVHCVLLGPWCLAAGIGMALYTFRVIDFGPGTWSLIANTGLIGAFIIACASEHLLGKYFGPRRTSQGSVK